MASPKGASPKAPELNLNLNPAEPMVVVGLMSGTSVDAIDACCVELSMADGRLQYDILETYTEPIPGTVRDRLLACMANQPVPLKELSSLNSVVGVLFARAVWRLVETTGFDIERIALLGSHGQTVFHQPPAADGLMGNTLQIGEPAIIAHHTSIPTVGDFRQGDMAAAGQGAPIVCFADQLLFQDERKGRCIQNIGGMANVTVLPAKNQPEAPVMAFDTGPGNALIDGAMRRFFNQQYDAAGATAAQGHVNTEVLNDLMAHEFIGFAPPKSTGRESFGQAFLETLVSRYALSGEDWVATLTEFTAASMADAYTRFVFPQVAVEEVILGGGGVKNPVLLKRFETLLKQQQKKIRVTTHAAFGIDDQYKEALAFAILAWATVHRMPNNLPACTGARRPVVMGKLCWF